MNHICSADDLEFRESTAVEAHGLDCGPYETFHDQWWECRVCGAKFTEAEAADLIVREAAQELT